MVELNGLAVDERTALLLERRGLIGDVDRTSRVVSRRRGWLVRRALVAADIVGLVLAFLIAHLIALERGDTQAYFEFVALVPTIPLWMIAAKLSGLYERDEEYVDHSTVDEVVGVFHLVTLGAWLYFVAWLAAGWLAADIVPNHMRRLVVFWLLAIVLVTAFRGIARGLVRRSSLYLQNTSSSAQGTSANSRRASSFSTPSTGSTSSASSTAIRALGGQSSMTSPFSAVTNAWPRSSPCSMSSA